MDPVDLARLLREKGDVQLGCPRCFEQDQCPWAVWHARADNVRLLCRRCWYEDKQMVALTEVDKGGGA